MKNNFKYLFALILLSQIALWGCLRYADDITPIPKITVRQAGSVYNNPVKKLDLKEQAFVNLIVTLNAGANIKSLRITDQANTELVFLESFNGVGATYNWTYKVPENTPAGTKILLKHTLTDLNDNASEDVFDINVLALNAPTVAVKILGGTDMFSNTDKGFPVTVSADFSAPEGVKEMRISASGAGITAAEVVVPASSLTASPYNYIYTVPLEATPGEQLTLSFVLVDVLNKQSSPSVFTINVQDSPTYTITTITHLGVSVEEIKGIINKMVTLNATKKYLLGGSLDGTSGSVGVAANGSLTIPAGTNIYGKSYDPASAIRAELEVNGTINASGTSANPVVFTSDKELNAVPNGAAGDWVGLVFLEGAKGAIQYLRVEFAGDNRATSLRDGAFNFSKTTTNLTMSYVQSYNSAKEGFRFRGGNVQIKYAVATNSVAESFRLDDEGGATYNGKGQFWIATHNSASETIGVRDGTTAILSNITIIGNNGANNALRIRDANSKLRIFNTLAAFNSTGLRFFATAAGPFAITDPLVMAHGRYFSNAANYHSTTTAYDTQLNNTTDVVAGIAVGDFVPDEAPTGIDASTIDAFFTGVSFIGAVQNTANNWTIGWTR
jgi:hypothetical protein